MRVKIVKVDLLGQALEDYKKGALPLDISVQIPVRANGSVVKLFNDKETAELELALNPTLKPGWLHYNQSNPFWCGPDAFEARLTENNQVFDTSIAEDKLALAILKASKIVVEETAENADLINFHIVSVDSAELSDTTVLYNYDKIVLALNALPVSTIAGILIAIGNVRADLIPENLSKSALLDFFKKTIFSGQKFNSAMITRLVRYIDTPTDYLATQVLLEAGIYAGAIKYAGSGVEKPYELNGKVYDYAKAVAVLAEGSKAKAAWVDTILEYIKNKV